MPANITHSVTKHPDNWDTPVWRYMNLPKLVSLLSSRALHYCRIDRLPDPYEGRYPHTEHERLKRIEEHLQQDGKHIVTRKEAIDELMRHTAYVNCWCLQENESDALWRIYGGEFGVALKSTYRLLVNSLREEDIVTLVNYVDYDSAKIADVNVLELVTHKRVFFAHEQEVRIVRWGKGVDMENAASQPVIEVPIDLESVLETVVVSPEAQDWYVRVVKDLLNQFRVDVPVCASSISSEPFRAYHPVTSEQASAEQKLLELAERQSEKH